MKISAVISEFNPFHLGHQYLINKIRENGTTHIVAVMSGNFVQRGEPAMFSKWSRAKMALTSGVDLVIEIPVAMSVSTAQRYAYKGIEIVNSLGCVDALCFGSECGDTKALEIVSDALLENHIFDDIKSYLSRGMTYAKARECAIGERLGLGFKGIVCQPNNILAIEYIKAIKQMKCEFSFETISRVGAQHDSKNRSGDGIVSASLIRDFVKKNIEICGYVPSESEKIILRETELGNAPADILNVERAVLAKMRSLDVQDILNLPDISEGIEHRILNAVKDARSIDDLYFKIKTKRYTMSRIRRIVLSSLLGITNKAQEAGVPYIRVLGFSQRGKDVLALMKNTAKLPVISSYSQVKRLGVECEKAFELENKTSNLYSLMTPKVQPCDMEKTSKIIVI